MWIFQRNDSSEVSQINTTTFLFDQKSETPDSDSPKGTQQRSDRVSVLTQVYLPSELIFLEGETH